MIFKLDDKTAVRVNKTQAAVSFHSMQRFIRQLAAENL